MYDELERDHNLCRKMLAGMAMRLHQLMTDVEIVFLHSGKQRIIIGYRCASRRKRDQNGVNVAITCRPTGVIASRLNPDTRNTSTHPATN